MKLLVVIILFLSIDVDAQLKPFLINGLKYNIGDTSTIKEITKLENSLKKVLDSFIDFKNKNKTNSFKDTSINLILYSKIREGVGIINYMDTLNKTINLGIISLYSEVDYNAILNKYITNYHTTYTIYKKQLFVFVVRKNRIINNYKTKLKLMSLSLKYLSKKTKNDIFIKPLIKSFEIEKFRYYSVIL